jgi:hypothetical protein
MGLYPALFEPLTVASLNVAQRNFSAAVQKDKPPANSKIELPLQSNPMRIARKHALSQRSI